MTKFLIGVATAALWFALSHAANAEPVCRQICDSGTCVTRCLQRPDFDVAVREREPWGHHNGGFDVDTPAGEVTMGDLTIRR